MVDLVHELNDTHGRAVSLVGWSLGGLYARQLAKMMPERVRSVITLGSPFAAGPKATNAWRVYEMASARRADEEDLRFGGSLTGAPPVPTTAIFSRTDGICAWQSCREEATAMSESIEVESSHCGMGHHPAVVYAVADRLAQAEGKWLPFDRSGWRSLIYPDPPAKPRPLDAEMYMPRDPLGGDLPLELGNMDSSTLKRSAGPSEVVVLNCWVTETKETPWAVESGQPAKSASDPGKRANGRPCRQR